MTHFKPVSTKSLLQVGTTQALKLLSGVLEMEELREGYSRWNSKLIDCRSGAIEDPSLEKKRQSVDYGTDSKTPSEI